VKRSSNGASLIKASKRSQGPFGLAVLDFGIGRLQTGVTDAWVLF
jgi:hypothetical protein